MKYSENKCTHLAYQSAYGRKAQIGTEGQLCIKGRTLWSCTEAWGPDTGLPYTEVTVVLYAMTGNDDLYFALLVMIRVKDSNTLNTQTSLR